MDEHEAEPAQPAPARRRIVESASDESGQDSAGSDKSASESSAEEETVELLGESLVDGRDKVWTQFKKGSTVYNTGDVVLVTGENDTGTKDVSPWLAQLSRIKAKSSKDRFFRVDLTWFYRDGQAPKPGGGFYGLKSHEVLFSNHKDDDQSPYSILGHANVRVFEEADLMPSTAPVDPKEFYCTHLYDIVDKKLEPMKRASYSAEKDPVANVVEHLKEIVAGDREKAAALFTLDRLLSRSFCVQPPPADVIAKLKPHLIQIAKESPLVIAARAKKVCRAWSIEIPESDSEDEVSVNDFHDSIMTALERGDSVHGSPDVRVLTDAIVAEVKKCTDASVVPIRLRTVTNLLANKLIRRRVLSGYIAPRVIATRDEQTLTKRVGSDWSLVAEVYPEVVPVFALKTTCPSCKSTKHVKLFTVAEELSLAQCMRCEISFYSHEGLSDYEYDDEG
eukprot:TRINITY_DN4261_c0_g1_i2.p1 TRINITY_DN4261_c0_g1~~TRINITY_DN4261_c0_g1_i2.p1  ORF type:complete len:513 (-),score=112.34 TRINITY_DN4261_c0_g1_i2:153-1499(-)